VQLNGLAVTILRLRVVPAWSRAGHRHSYFGFGGRQLADSNNATYAPQAFANTVPSESLRGELQAAGVQVPRWPPGPGPVPRRCPLSTIRRWSELMPGAVLLISTDYPPSVAGCLGAQQDTASGPCVTLEGMSVASGYTPPPFVTAAAIVGALRQINWSRPKRPSPEIEIHR